MDIYPWLSLAFIIAAIVLVCIFIIIVEVYYQLHDAKRKRRLAELSNVRPSGFNQTSKDNGESFGSTEATILVK